MKTASELGFSLAELMISTVMVALIGIGACALLMLALNMNRKDFGWTMLYSGGTLGTHRLSKDAIRTTAVVAPPTGSADDVFEGYAGRVNAGSSGAPIWVNAATGDASGQYTRFRYCLDGAGRLMYFSDRHDIASDPPAVPACGAGPGWETIVSNPIRVVGRQPGGDLFARPAGAAANFVEAFFDLVDDSAQPARSFEVRMTLATQARPVP